MLILKTCGWDNYELLDSGNGFRLERFGKYILKRPDPQAIWQPSQNKEVWRQTNAVFLQGKNNQGFWQKNSLPEKWEMSYKDYRFFAKLSAFKHTGVFPEQQINWDFIAEQIKKTNRDLKILNLFAYTGIATLVAAKIGAFVTHVDASKPAITWAKENAMLSKIAPDRIRWILDDAVRFVEREGRRGAKYDGIIMDPPVYGHGPNGETWDFLKDFPGLLQNCRKILSEKPLFVIANAYAVSASAIMLGNLFTDNFSHLKGSVEYGELALQEKSTSRLLSTGIFARWFGCDS